MEENDKLQGDVMQAVAALVLRDLYNSGRTNADIMNTADKLCVAIGAGVLEAIGIYGSQGPETLNVGDDHWIDRDIPVDPSEEDRSLLELYMISLGMRIADRHSPDGRD